MTKLSKFLGNLPLFGKGSHDLIDQLIAGQLPIIRGKWFYVDPYAGSATNSGDNFDNAVNSIALAYALCTDGAGDGIVVFSGGTSSAHTTSYLEAELAWAKSGITVVGVAAPISMFGRARIANKKNTTGSISTISFTADHTISDSAGGFLAAGFEAGQKIYVNTTSNTNDGVFVIDTVTATTITTTAGSAHVTTESAATAGATVITNYLVNLMTVSGNNNTFLNLHLYNGGNDTYEIGGLYVSGSRNAFVNCHFAGGVGAAAAATKYSLEIDAGQENLFRNCTIGSDTFDHANNADVELILNGTVARNRFENCEFIGFTSTGTAHGAVKSVSTSGGSPTVFKGCTFNYGLSASTPAAAHLVSGSVDRIILQDCAAYNVTAWGTYVRANMVAPAASAAGGLGTNA